MKNGLKFAGIFLAAVIMLSIITGTRATMPQFAGRGGVMSFAPSTMPSFDSVQMYEGGNYAVSGKSMDLSTRNVMGIMPPIYGGTTGNSAEAFEVTDYNATIETNDLDSTCGAIASWKAKDYVIFENSSTYDRGCNYTFKVEKDYVTETLAALKGLDPKELIENTRTIKNVVDDYTSQTEILQKKLAAIDQTLKNAMEAYDEITEIATKSNDASSLAKIIDSKIQIIERLTQERINVSMQLDQYARAKAQELDKLDYTYFNVAVYENKYVDGKNIADSWKQALRNFVSNINRTIQDITIGLIAFILIAIQYLIYIFILVVFAKYAWRMIRKLWKK